LPVRGLALGEATCEGEALFCELGEALAAGLLEDDEPCPPQDTASTAPAAKATSRIMSGHCIPEQAAED
jgi:hypothetical protein